MDVTVIKDFKNLDISYRTLFMLLACADDKGIIRLNQETFAKGIHTSRQSVGSHLKKLALSNILKYKYSGFIMFNPDVIFFGSEEDKKQARSEYASFVSDAK